ncbi:transcription factor IBH1-like [Wolffia australiana]
MHKKISPGNPNHSKHKQALYFIQALKRFKKKNPARRVQCAAYAAMAVAAGSRRAWSRSIILSLRKNSRASFYKRVKIVEDREKMKVSKSRAEQLRRLLPGARKMDFCCLLDETADYINFLTAQIEIMQKIADSLGQERLLFGAIQASQ